MNKITFDEILKKNIINTTGVDLFGYNNTHSLYYNNYIFEKFVNQMLNDYPNHYYKYSRGKGSELKPQGNTPPKMASVASSSRFCYLALRNGATALGGYGNVEFEHECRIDGITGTAPQMDAYIKNGNIFVEAKCHEIFDAHKITLSKQYFDLLFGESNDFGLEYIPQKKMSDYGFVEKGNEFELPFDKMGIYQPKMLDFKQMICHLMGIRSHKQQEETATLIYMFFKPKASTKEQNDEINAEFVKLTNEITTIFGSNVSPINRFAKKNNIKLKAVAQYAEVMSPLTVENLIQLYP